MALTQEDLNTVLETRDVNAKTQARQDLAFKIIAQNSSQFFQGHNQGKPNSHLTVRQLTDLAFSIAEEALISETKLQFKG